MQDSNLSLDDLFELALYYVQNSFAREQYGDSGRTLSNEDQLIFYSYFKQATIGKCNTSRPGFFDIVGRYKWDFWNKLGDMDAKTAKEKYVEKITQMAPEWLKFSKMQPKIEELQKKKLGKSPMGTTEEEISVHHHHTLQQSNC